MRISAIYQCGNGLAVEVIKPSANQGEPLVSEILHVGSKINFTVCWSVETTSMRWLPMSERLWLEMPDRRGFIKSDKWIALRIRNGAKSQMTAFGEKFSQSDVDAIVAYLGTLN